MTLDWSRLEHAYGSAADLPRLFDEIGDPELADEAREDLWASLYDQGSVFAASLAAVAVLTDIAAGRIVVEEQQLHEPGYVQTRYPAAINELYRITQNVVLTKPFEGDVDDPLYWLEHLLAYEGVPVWRRSLRREVHPVVCPSCALSLEIDLSYKGPGTRGRDPNARFQVVGREGPVVHGIRPADPVDLPPLASRLHHVAVRAGQPAAAEHLTHLFGSTTCPGRSDFAVPDQVAACS